MSSSWITEKNARTAYSGLHLNRPWEDWIIIDHEPINKKFLARTAIIDILSTFSQVEYVLSPERVTSYAKGYFPDPRGPYFYVALLLVILNAAETSAEIVKDRSSSLEENSQAEASNPPVESAPTGMEKILVVVSKATPYLMIIANIAMTVIQIHRGDSSAWITLGFTGITLIDITSWKPKEYRWYLNTILGYPVAAGAIYYSNNLSRLKIIFNLAISNQTLAKLVEKTFSKQISELYKWLEETRVELEQRLLELHAESDESSSDS